MIVLGGEGRAGVDRVRALALWLLVLAGLLVAAGEVGAQATEDNIFGPVLLDFETQMQQVAGRIGNLLLNLFYALALIEIVVSVGLLVLRGAGIEEVLAELVLRVLFIGFFLWLLDNGSAIPVAIVESFLDLGSRAAGSGQQLSPDDVIDLGIGLMKSLVENLGWGRLLVGMAMLAVGLVVFFILVMIAANLTVALIEFYIVGYGGIVLLGFGGSGWTKGFAVAYLKYAVSVGMKLFTLLVIAGVALGVVEARVAATDQQNLVQLLTLAGFVVVLWVVSTKVPDSIAGALQGVDTNRTLSNASGASTVVSSGGSSLNASVTSVAGYGAAAVAAARLASAQPGSRVANTVRNFGSAFATDVAQKAAGRADGGVFPSTGIRGGRMASRMNHARKLIRGR